MDKTIIEVYLSNKLPQQYASPPTESKEEAVKDVEELKSLYEVKYGTFGEVVFNIYDERQPDEFVIALNDLFKRMGSDTKVDVQLLGDKIELIVPLIVVDNEVISKGVYPELVNLRGGSNSVSRGGTGHHH